MLATCGMCGGVFEGEAHTTIPLRFCGGTVCHQMLAIPPPSPTTAQLLIDIADGLRVLNTRDGLNIPEETIQERARNLAQAILGNYKVERLPDL